MDSRSSVKSTGPSMECDSDGILTLIDFSGIFTYIYEMGFFEGSKEIIEEFSQLFVSLKLQGRLGSVCLQERHVEVFDNCYFVLIDGCEREIDSFLGILVCSFDSCQVVLIVLDLDLYNFCFVYDSGGFSEFDIHFKWISRSSGNDRWDEVFAAI